MKVFKKVAAALAAIAVAAMVVAPTVARATDVTKDEAITAEWVKQEAANKISVDLLAAGVDVTKAVTAKITLKVAALSAGTGGGFTLNSESTGWGQKEYGMSGEGADISKDITPVATGNAGEYVITRTAETTLFQSTDTYAQIFVEGWWGDNVVFTKIEILDKDGKVILTTAPEPIKAGDTVNLATDGRVVKENLADGVQDKEMTLNGTKISDKVIGLKPVTDTNSKVAYTVTVDKAGKYDLEVVYNAKGDKRPMAVKVNDGKATDVALASTGDDYTTCGTVKVTVELKAGENTITFSQASTYDNSTVKAPNLVSAKVVAQAAQQPATGVSSMAIIVCGIAVLLCAAAVTFTAKKRA